MASQDKKKTATSYSTLGTVLARKVNENREKEWVTAVVARLPAMRFAWRHLPAVICAALLVLAFHTASAHEPLFGLGPHTIYKYGYAVESQLEKGPGGWANQFELLYGLTSDWAVTLAAPYTFPAEGRADGFTALGLRTKFRFFRADGSGSSRQVALHAGVKSTVRRAERGNNEPTRYFVGLSYGYESRRHYFFGGVRMTLAGALAEVGEFEYDLAYGIRPWLLRYLQPDPVFLLEVISEKRKREETFAPALFSLAPGLLFSYRNVMLKTGVKIPISTDPEGADKQVGPEMVLGLEVHFPPLK